MAMAFFIQTAFPDMQPQPLPLVRIPFNAAPSRIRIVVRLYGATKNVVVILRRHEIIRITDIIKDPPFRAADKVAAAAITLFIQPINPTSINHTASLAFAGEGMAGIRETGGQEASYNQTHHQFFHHFHFSFSFIVQIVTAYDARR
jgi:hypothetical protein